MTAESSPRLPDLASLTIRELLAELTRIENRLNNQRAASNYRTTPESARLERRMREISAHLRNRRTDTAGTTGPDPAPEADEADLLEQSIPVRADPEEEYPRQ